MNYSADVIADMISAKNWDAPQLSQFAKAILIVLHRTGDIYKADPAEAIDRADLLIQELNKLAEEEQAAIREEENRAATRQLMRDLMMPYFGRE